MLSLTKARKAREISNKLFPDDNTITYFESSIQNLYLSQKPTNGSECILATSGIHHNYMEDNRSIYHRDDISIYAVYDGHGGLETSRKAASELSEAIYQKLNNILPHNDEYLIKNTIKEAFYEFDKDLVQDFKKYEYDGSTVTMVIYIKDQQDSLKDRMYFVNLGDSRTIFIQITELVELIFSTEDHKPTSATEIERINKAGGIVEYGRVNGNLAVSRGLGDLNYKTYKTNTGEIYYDPIHSPVSAEPDIFCISGTPGILVLASDGLWDVLTNNDIVDIVQNNSSKIISNISNMCKSLITEAIHRKSRDNITVMVIVIG